MSDVVHLEAGLARLPIFPLPDAVLLPHELIPLHVFEPRYRAMTRDCLAGGRMLALAQIHPGSMREGKIVEPPRVLPVVGLGLIAQSELLADGRYQIVVQGIGRARIAEELGTDLPYRIVHAELLQDEEVDSVEAKRAQETLSGLLLALRQARPGKGADALAEFAANADGPSELADLLGAAILDSARERQALLEERSVAKRLERISQAVAAHLAQHVPRPTLLN